MKRQPSRSNKPAARRPTVPEARSGKRRDAATLPSRLSANRIAALLPLLLIAVTILAYQPVWHAGFVWDDDYYVTQNPALRDLEGLRRIWFQVGAVPQYYPLVYTVFWAEYHLWGFQPLGYHVVNVLLHALAAILLARMLVRLRIPGAWLAAFIFALHPVCVESVAWVTELKNVLSIVFYLAAALTYWRFAELQDAGGANQRRWGWYAVALALFAAALLSKTVTCSLPAALLLVRWWEKGRLRSADILPAVPFFALGAGLGLQTAWIEQHVIGAHGAEWSSTFAQRCLVAGRALWFYAGKLVWPTNLTFIYPRWTINTAVWWQWLFPLAALGLPVALWLARRRIGRGPLVAVLYFAGSLGPALGFFNVYLMRYSFVADHFQYLACIGLITLAAAGISAQFSSLKTRRSFLEPVFCGTLLVAMGVLTWRQAGMFANVEALWRTTIARNPDCPMAYDNLGDIFFRRGQVDQAVAQFQKALAIQPDDEYAHNDLGTVFLQKGQVDEALIHFRKAVEVQPDHAQMLYNLGTALLQKGQRNEAITQFQRALERRPGDATIHNSLGIAFFQEEQWDAAAAHFQEALRIQPDNARAHTNLGTALLRNGRIDEAVAHYQKALEIRPDLAEAYYNLRHVAWVLATSPEASVRNGAKAVELAQQAERLSGATDPMIVGTLAAAYAEAGRFPEATAAGQRALQLATAQNKTALVNDLRAQVILYETGQPYHETGAGAPRYMVK